MYCRLCLCEQSEESFIDLFQDIDGDECGLDYIKIIEKYLEIEVAPDDVVSTAICKDCHNQLEDFHTYRQIVEEKQKTIYCTIKQSRIKTERHVKDHLLLALEEFIVPEHGDSDKTGGDGWENQQEVLEEDNDVPMVIAKEEIHERSTQEQHGDYSENKQTNSRTKHNDPLFICDHNSGEIVATKSSDKLKMFTNRVQFKRLIEEMQKHPELDSCRKGTEVTPNFKDLWDNLARILNTLGTTRRLGDGWLKVWRDFKFKTKKKVAANKAAASKGNPPVYKISPLEQDVAEMFEWLPKTSKHEKRIIQLQQQKQNVQKSKSNKLRYFVSKRKPEEIETATTSTATTTTTTTIEAMPVLNKDYEIIQIEAPVQMESTDIVSDSYVEEICPNETLTTSTNIQTHDESFDHIKPKITIKCQRDLTATPIENKKIFISSSKDHENVDSFNEKLYNSEQTDILRELYELLTSVKRSLMELNNYQKKILYLKEAKLKLLQARNRREEEMHQCELKLKNMEIRIKEREYQNLCL
ncbi:uncharacterized protein [Musca autumnalis]|uniref:uncharacterized protein n=1 Tax=Musca autumnalis TaxID=221902 RepID=UPI003CF80D51